MVFADGEGEVVFPESNDPVRLFLFIAVDIQEHFRSLGIDILCHFARRIKSFGIGQVIHQLGEIGCHLVGVGGRLVLDLQPAVFVFLDE